MEEIKIIFSEGFYRPLFNALIFIYYYIPGKDFGITIILFTILIKLGLYPLGAKAIRSQKALSKISPRIKEIQEKYKNNKEKQTKEIMDFYKTEKINPLSGCLPVLIQFPILIALFRIFQGSFEKENIQYLLYNFTPNPETIYTNFLGIVNLIEPNIFFALISSLSLFFQIKISSPNLKKFKKDDFQYIMQKQMQFLMPVFSFFILLKLPSALGLYWTISTLFAIGQHHIINKKSIV